MQLLLGMSRYNISRAVSNILFVFYLVIGAKQTISIWLNNEA